MIDCTGAVKYEATGGITLATSIFLLEVVAHTCYHRLSRYCQEDVWTRFTLHRYRPPRPEC